VEEIDEEHTNPMSLKQKSKSYSASPGSKKKKSIGSIAYKKSSETEEV
jgi:hypothetical protein